MMPMAVFSGTMVPTAPGTCTAVGFLAWSDSPTEASCRPPTTGVPQGAREGDQAVGGDLGGELGVGPDPWDQVTDQRQHDRQAEQKDRSDAAASLKTVER
jgi:hypothetical protein